MLAGVWPALLSAQQAASDSAAGELAAVPLPEPAENALPLPEDRGHADLEQALKRLGTTASVLAIVAHPDDEDGALLTWLSRGLGVRATLMTLTRGEGGQNAMSAEADDALGLIRTNELLKADEYYGVKQLWGTEADFGFSKTQAESFAKWGHERVLYDAVLAVRPRPSPGFRRNCAGGIQDSRRSQRVSRSVEGWTATLAASGRLFADPICAGHCQRHLRLRNRQVGAGEIS
jgi:hypothetical protein